MELPGKFTYPFSYTPHPLVREAAERLISAISSDAALDALFRDGKMLGVLLCSPAGQRSSLPSGCAGLHRFAPLEVPPLMKPRVATGGKTSCPAGEPVILCGFSGLAGGSSHVEGFVPPIFDLTDPDGHFRKREAEISAMAPGDERKKASQELQEWIFRQFVVNNALGESSSVLDIFARRGLVPPGGTGECALPKMLQYAYSNGLQPRAFGEFWYGRSPAGELRRHGCFYPSCTGKCGPLLEYMLAGLDVEENPMEENRGWVFAEGFRRSREDGTPVPCDGCGCTDPGCGAGNPMDDRRTIGILHEDDRIIVVDKPSGLLSVPGRIDAPSLLVLLQRRENERHGRTAAEGHVTIYSCHRLDMDTSGIMVFAKRPEVQAEIQRMFENRELSKTYIARLSAGDRELRPGEKGVISLPMMLDYYDRPRQIVDFAEGKEAVTEYEVLAVYGDDSSSDVFGPSAAGEALVRFHPKTGRSHQLRVHSAHPSGLGRAIVGDRLYGGDDGSGRRLALHSCCVSGIPGLDRP